MRLSIDGATAGIRRLPPAARGLRLAAALLGATLPGCSDATAPEPVAFSCNGAGEVIVDGQPVRVAPNGYFTAGNQIISVATCQPHRFIGVARPGLESWSFGDARLQSDTATAADFRRMRSWGFNVVRIPVSQSFWLPASKTYYNPHYPALVERTVRLAREAGLDVILDLHSSDRGDPNYAGLPGTKGWGGLQQMADVNHSVPFWRELAAKYKDDGRVIFELYNEPFEISWDVWLNGGYIPAGIVYDEQRVGFQAAGMQQLYETVRGTGAHNLVIVSGMHWGYYLDGVPRNRVKGHNIAYGSHPYDYADKQPDTWEKSFGFLADTDPVIITEFGNFDCSPGYPNAVIDLADRRNMSWVAWAWWTPEPNQVEREKGICEFPALIQDWSGAPSRYGQIIQRRIPR